ncbi:hypothetical protein M8J76_015345 [Diaphorina citri]|nr:hypothetical protein M8J76_002376 [Diaphorina citri]KAI5716970.1 hypothetical protein M8J76_015345 [Diaphorina citri]
MSSQGVVERATSEISKRINNLTLGKNKSNTKHNNTNNNNNQTNLKTSVMERVTNVFCGSGHIPSSHNLTTQEKNTTNKSSYRSKSANNVTSITPSLLKRKIPNPSSALIGFNRNNNLTSMTNISDLLLDEAFLAKFFFYFSPLERSVLAQVCFKWKEVLYKNPKYWTGLIPVIRSKELRSVHINDMNKLYSSIVRRNFQCISLLSATDEDVVSFVNAFPLASKHIRSLSLSCSSVTDRGLETLMDHLQVRHEHLFYFVQIFNLFWFVQGCLYNDYDIFVGSKTSLYSYMKSDPIVLLENIQSVQASKYGMTAIEYDFDNYCNF